MSDRTRVSTPRSVKKQQQRTRRDAAADAAIMAGVQEERETTRLRNAATKSANLARARRAQESRRLEQSSIEGTPARGNVVADPPLSPYAAEFFPSIQEVAFNIRGQLQDSRVANFQGTEAPT
jgi:hypothetical protein